jgi:hypothetical protein
LAVPSGARSDLSAMGHCRPSEVALSQPAFPYVTRVSRTRALGSCVGWPLSGEPFAADWSAMHTRTFPRFVALFAIVLIAGAALCVFDSDEGQSGGVDLCVLLFTVASATVLPVILASAERLVPVRALRSPLMWLDASAPPPKA